MSASHNPERLPRRHLRGTEIEDHMLINPLFARPGEDTEYPRWTLPEKEMQPQTAYQIVSDEMMLDGNARQNLATFVTTWMDPWADKLYSQAYNKNSIDKDEYPQTAAIEQRCIRMLAHLWNSPEADTTLGTATIGSSEACMLGGIALKKQWQTRHKKAGKSADKPNIVFSSTVQVVWEKFVNYWDIEPRYIPITVDHPNMDPTQLEQYVDENTIGVVAILGATYTGGYEDVEAIARALDTIQENTGLDIPIHVDAASGGFIAPFLEPDLEWDFRIPRVFSINSSGHKFGLVYPGLGWVIWRSKNHVPTDMIFWVDYLGGNEPTLTLNYSRPGAQILLQYYSFLTLGKSGYRRVQQASLDNARYTAKKIGEMPEFEVYTAAEHMPLITWRLKNALSKNWDIYDLSNELRGRGWQVPAYPLTANATDVHLLRIVFRNGVSRDLCDLLLSDIKTVIAGFDTLTQPLPHAAQRTTKMYDHN
jgi:glutamate decarboxylase